MHRKTNRMKDPIVPYKSKLEFTSFQLMDDFVIHVRQPHQGVPLYQVISEDSYGDAKAQMMTPSQLWEKWRVKL